MTKGENIQGQTTVLKSKAILIEGGVFRFTQFIN